MTVKKRSTEVVASSSLLGGGVMYSRKVVVME